MRFKKILRSPTSTNHSLNAISSGKRRAQSCGPRQREWVV
jgi:hypothetical protein